MRTAIVLYVYSAIVALVIAYEIVLSRRRRRQKKRSRETSLFLLLVRDLIDTAYTYNTDPAKFYQKFLEQVNISSLRKRGITDPEVLLRTAGYIIMCKDMRGADAELWALRKAGFTNRELKVVYNLKNLNSIYVKNNRLKKRLDKRVAAILPPDKQDK